MTLLARTASSLYWAGRYLERAEMTARIYRVHSDTHVDLPVGEDIGWWPLLAITAAESAFEARHGAFRQMGWRPVARVTPTEAQVSDLVLADRDNPSSVLACLASTRDNLRVARPVVPRESWEICNDLWHTLNESRPKVRVRDGRVRWLMKVLEGCQRLNGALWASMRRDEAMAFLRIGQQLERSDMTCRVLDVHAESVLRRPGEDAYEEVRRSAVLRALDAYQQFRRTRAVRPGIDAVARFVIQDERFPRSIAACVADVRDLLKSLPRNEHVLAACGDAAVALAEPPTVSESGLDPVAELRAFCRGLLEDIASVHVELDGTYFELFAPEHGRFGARHAFAAPPAASTTDGPPTTMIVPVAGLHAATVPSYAGTEKIYRVSHITTYRYGAPVDHSSNEAHLGPRDSPSQRRLAHEIRVDPQPDRFAEFSDVFGNTVTTFSVTGGFTTMTVSAVSEVSVKRRVDVPTRVPWEAVRDILGSDRHATTREARRYVPASRLVPVGSSYLEYASQSFVPGAWFADAVVDLMQRIHRDFTYAPESTTVMTPLSDVFEKREGVCQDFAHLAVACLRSLGLAARYVSGYIETSPPVGHDKLVGADSSHAWASAYIPDWGWLDFDPTNNQVAVDRHITTAWGRDYWDVSPLRGTLEGGGDTHSLEVAVDVACLVASAA